jgi:hypothetical protein
VKLVRIDLFILFRMFNLYFLDISANDLHENLLQYSEFSSRIHCRFFPFWPPRDVDLLQWLSHWIKQGK